MSASKEILRGTVSLNTSEFEKKLNDLPELIKQKAGPIKTALDALGQTSASSIAAAIAPLSQLTAELNKITPQLNTLKQAYDKFGTDTNASLRASSQEQVATVRQTEAEIAREKARNHQVNQQNTKIAGDKEKEQIRADGKVKVAETQASTKLINTALADGTKERIANANIGYKAEKDALDRAEDAKQASLDRAAKTRADKIKAEAALVATAAKNKRDDERRLDAQMEADEKVLAGRIAAQFKAQEDAKKAAQTTAQREAAALQKTADEAQLAEDKRFREQRHAEVDRAWKDMEDRQKQHNAQALNSIRDYNRQAAAAEHQFDLEDRAEAKQQRQVVNLDAGVDDRLHDNLRKIAAEGSRAQQALEAVEKEVYQLFRAGAQIAQLSFMMSAFSTAVLGGLGALMKSAEGFDQWLRKGYAAGKVTGEFAISLDQLKNGIIDLSGEIGSFSPDEIAQAFYKYQSAVGSTISTNEELTVVLREQLLPVLQAAAIAGISVDQVMTGVTSTAGEFGLKMDQLSHITQVMLAVTQVTNAEFGDVIESFKLVGSGAHNMGLSLEEVAAVMGRLADVNLRGGMSGRGFAQVLQSFVDPSEKAIKILNDLYGGSEALGNSWRDIIFAGGNFIGIMDKFSTNEKGEHILTQVGLVSQLAERLKGLTEADRSQALAGLESENGYRALVPLIKERITVTDSYNTSLQELYRTITNDPQGMFKEQWTIISEGIKEEVGKRLNVLKSGIIDLGLVTAKALIPIMDFFVRIIDKLKDLGNENPKMLELVLRVVAISAAVAAAAGAFGMFIGNLLQFEAAFKLIGPAIRVVTAEFAAIAAAGAVVWIPIITAMGFFVAAWRNNWQGIRDAVTGASQPLNNFITNVRASVGIAIAILRDLANFDFSSLGSRLEEIVIRAISSILNYVVEIGPALVRLFRAAMGDLDAFLTAWAGRGYIWGRDLATNMTAGLRSTLLDGIRSVVQQANTLIAGVGTLGTTNRNPTVVGRAFGGMVQPGEVTLVGEKGPEIVVLPPGAQVVPNRESMGIIAKGAATGTGIPTTSVSVTPGTATVTPTIAPLQAGPVLVEARRLGFSMADAFITGFTSADFARANEFLDNIMKNVQSSIESGIFGSGAQAIDMYITRLNQAIDITSDLVNVIKNGGQVTDEMYDNLSRVAGKYTDDILEIARAYGGVGNAQAAIKVTSETADRLNDEKQALDDQKDALQEKIALLNQQKEPYEAEINAIEKVIEGLNRQKRGLELQKQPLEDQKTAIDEIILRQQRSLEPLEDALRLINLQKEGYNDAKQAIDDVLQKLNDEKRAIEDQKQPYQDAIDAIDQRVEALNRVKEANNRAKEPLDDEKQVQQDIIAIIDAKIALMNQELESRKRMQEEALAPEKERLENDRIALADAKTAESDRHQIVQDRIDAENEALDVIKEQASAEEDAAQATIDAHKAALDILKEQEQLTHNTAQAQIDAERETLEAIKTRFALEEQMAASRTEQAKLLGASSNVTGFLQYQEAALKRSHEGQVAPAEAALSATEQAEKNRQDAVKAELDARDRQIKQEEIAANTAKAARDADIAAREAIINAEEKAESRVQDRINREFQRQERENANLERQISNQEKQDERDNRRLEREIEVEEAKKKNHEDAISDIDKELDAIERRNKTVDREIETQERDKQNQQDQIDLLDRQERAKDREIDIQNRAKERIDRDIAVLDRSAQNISRQEERINHEIELENRAKSRIDDEIRAIDERGKQIDREIALQNDRKNAPQDAMANIDAQVKAEQNRASEIDKQIKSKDREIELNSRVMKDQQEILKGEQDRLKTAQDVLAWHQKITEEIEKQNTKLKEGDQNPNPTTTETPKKSPVAANNADGVGLAGSDGNIPTDLNGRSVSVATQLWEGFKNKVADTLKFTTGVQTEQMTLVATHMGLATGLAADGISRALPYVEDGLKKAQDLVAKYRFEVVDTGGRERMVTAWKNIGGDIIDALRTGYTEAGVGLSNFFEDTGRAFARKTTNGIDDIVKWFDGGGLSRIEPGIQNWMDTKFKVVVPDFLERIVDVFTNLGERVRAFSPGTAIVDFFRGLEESMNKLNMSSIENLFNRLFDMKSLPTAIFSTVSEFFGSLKSLGSFDNIVNFLRTLFVGGEDVSRLALGFGNLTKGVNGFFTGIKGLLGSNPLTIWLTIIIDLIIVVIKHWNTFSENMMKVVDFVVKAFQENLAPVLESFIKGTLDRLEPAFKNLMIVLGFVDEVIQVLILAIGRMMVALAPIAGPLFEAMMVVLGAVWGILKNLWFIFLDIIGLDFKSLQKDLGNLFIQFWEQIQKLWPLLQEFLTNLLPAIGGMLVALGTTLRDAVVSLWNDHLHPALNDMIAALPGVWTQVKIDAVQMFSTLGAAIGEALGNVWDAICEPFRKAWDTLFGHSIVPDMINAAKDWFGALPGHIKDALVTVFEFITKPYQDAWNWISLTLFGEAGLKGTFISGFNAVVGTVTGFLGDWEGSTGMLGLLGTAFRWVIARAADWVGADPDKGIAGILDQGWKNIHINIGTFLGTWEGTTGVLGLLGTGFRNARDFIKGIIGGAGTGVETIFGVFSLGFGAVASWLGGAGGFIGNWALNGGGILGGIYTGLNSLKDGILGFIGVGGKDEKGTIFTTFSTGFNLIVDWFKDTFFGKEEDGDKGGILGKFKGGFDKLKTFIESAIGLDENSGFRKVFSGFANAINTVVTKVADLITRVGDLAKLALPSWLVNLAGKFGINIGGDPAGQPAPKPATGGSSAGASTPLHGDYPITQMPGDGTSHGNANAIDYGVPTGTPVYAIGPGTAIPGNNGTYGNYVDLVMADGNTFRYGHFNEMAEGGQVNGGDIVGYSGNTGYSTGPHLHFEHTAGPGMKFGDVVDWADGTLPNGMTNGSAQPNEQDNAIETAIGEAEKLTGTPYLLGGLRNEQLNPDGTPKDGVINNIDCSELTGYAYRNAANLTWNAQAQWGETTPVGKRNGDIQADMGAMRRGDLVFFRNTYDAGPGQDITHVGIYKGNGEMINAGSSGVADANITSGYWADHYAGSGRVLTGASGAYSGSGSGNPGLPNIGQRPTGPLGQAYDFLMEKVKGLIGPFVGAGAGRGNAAPSGNVPINAAGLSEQIARWIPQTRDTFGDLGSFVPPSMLAIIQHESDGLPTAYNSLGDAYGLFQQLHIGTFDPNEQFRLARGLAQEKLSMTNGAYGNLGLNPDNDRRARDLFLAWAGQFNPSNAGPSGARDIASGENGNEFLYGKRGIMAMYENITKNVPGYRDGMWNVPYDDMPAVLHKGEMVVKANFAEQLRAAVLGGPQFDLATQLRIAMPELMQTSSANMNNNNSTIENHYHVHVDGTAEARNPEDNIRILKREAYVTGGKFR